MIEAILNDACEDQHEALRAYARTRSPDDAAKIHIEACPICLRAIERIEALAIPSSTPKIESAAARLSKPKRLDMFHVFVATMLTGLLACLCAIILHARPDEGPPVSYYRDPETGACYAFVRRIDAGGARVPCERVDPRFLKTAAPTGSAYRTTYYRDWRQGLCYRRLWHSTLERIECAAIPVTADSELIEAEPKDR